MGEHVWILQRGMLAGNNLQADFLADISMDGSETEEDYLRESEINAALYRGELVPKEFIPKSLVSVYGDSKVKLDCDFFNSGFFIAVSSRLYDVMKDFDYGGGGFHSAIPYRKGKMNKPLADPFYLMNFAGKKNALLPDVSKQLLHNKRLDTYRALDLNDNDIVVSQVALEGADVWIDEKMNSFDIFLSGTLGDAIKAAKPTSRIYMSKCQVQQSKML